MSDLQVDTVNHKILLERLQHDIGISGVTLRWFKSYLPNGSQRIEVQGTSKNFNLECGVPQGSYLGPLLYIIYTAKLFKIIEHHLTDAHSVATLTTDSYISAFDQRMDCHLRLMSFKQCKDVLRA